MCCFGLVHKRAAGKYDFESKFGNLKIEDEKVVDEFMNSYRKCKSSTKVYFCPQVV